MVFPSEETRVVFVVYVGVIVIGFVLWRFWLGKR